MPVKHGRLGQFPGWKFSQYEMKGVPLRLEIGPKDIEKGPVRTGTPRQPRKTFLPRWMSWRRRPQRLTELGDSLYHARWRTAKPHLERRPRWKRSSILAEAHRLYQDDVVRTPPARIR